MLRVCMHGLDGGRSALDWSDVELQDSFDPRTLLLQTISSDDVLLPGLIGSMVSIFVTLFPHCYSSKGDQRSIRGDQHHADSANWFRCSASAMAILCARVKANEEANQRSLDASAKFAPMQVDPAFASVSSAGTIFEGDESALASRPSHGFPTLGSQFGGGISSLGLETIGSQHFDKGMLAGATGASLSQAIGAALVAGTGAANISQRDGYGP